MSKIGKMVKIAIPILLVAVLLTVAACGQAVEPPPSNGGNGTEPPPTPPPAIKVANLGDLTGPQSSSTGVLFKGTQDYWEYVNEELGGIDGAEVMVIWGDSKSDATTATGHTERFIDAGVVTVDASSTSDILASRALLERAKLPAIGATGTTALLIPPSVIYSTIPESAQIFATGIAFLYEEWVKKGLNRPMKIAIVSWDIPACRTGSAGVKKWVEMQEPGVAELVYEAYVPMTTVDFTPELSGAKAAGADVVQSCVVGGTMGMMARDMGKVGFADDVLNLQWSVALGPGPRELAGDQVARIRVIDWYAQPYETNYVMIPLANRLAKENQGMDSFSSGYFLGFAAAKLTHEAIKLALAEVGHDKLDNIAVAEHGFNQMRHEDYGLGTRINFSDGSRIGPTQIRILKWNTAEDRTESVSDWLELIPYDLIYPSE